MPKAKLSQMASTWIEEEEPQARKKQKLPSEQPKKKQTINLRPETIKRLWLHRARTGKTLSDTLDELVLKHVRDN